MSSPVVLKGVTKWFGREQVLKGLDLELPLGSVTALLGRNGGGKSTAMRIMTGVLARDGGEAEVFGKDAEALGPAELERLAYVTDSGGAAPSARVGDELALVRRIRGRRWDAARAGALLRRFEIAETQTLGALSKGQQTRLRLVLALAADPELLLLDEPALGLDLFARHDLLDAIIETVEREGRAVLLTSHLIDDIERVADRVVFLRDGVANVQGSVDELRARFRSVRLAVGAGGAPALEAAAKALLGVRRVLTEPGMPAAERAVILDGPADGLVAELERRASARVIGEPRSLTLREIYFEVLGGKQPQEVAA